VTPVVIDASAGVELAADTASGKALQKLLPANAVPWVPDVFYVECGSVLRRWDRRSVLAPHDIASAVESLLQWPLRVAAVKELFIGAWALRGHVTFADAVYVALAKHLGAPVLTNDKKLAGAPGLPVAVLHL
jgi:predicted nucleic acid-binding protein